MYLVKSKVVARTKINFGADVDWVVGQIRGVEDEYILRHQNDPNSFTVLSSPTDITSNATGTMGGATSVTETGDVVHKTTFTLTDYPVTLTDDAGVGQFAALKLYDFPAGNIITLGAAINASLTLNEAWWVDTSAGSVGLGTTASADASTIAATRQNIIAVTAVAAMTAQVGAINAQSTVVGVSGVAGGTDADVVLNINIADDVAHMPDVVTNGAFTTNTTGWTLGAGWAAGSAKVDATTSSTALSQAVTLVPGVAYSITYTTTRSAGSVRPTLGGTLGTSRSTANTFTETIIPVTASGLSFTGTGFTGSIDTVSCTPLTGSGKLNGAVTVVWTNGGDY
jgi:hypothetical protein